MTKVDDSSTIQLKGTTMDSIETFFTALSSTSEGLFDGVIDFVKGIYGAFEGLLSSGSSE